MSYPDRPREFEEARPLIVTGHPRLEKFRTGVVAGIGGIVAHEVRHVQGIWELRVFRNIPVHGDSGISTYIADDALCVLSEEHAFAKGRWRGQVLNGIFVNEGAP